MQSALLQNNHVTLIEKLRLACASSHQELETNPLLCQLSAPDIEKNTYSFILQKFLAINSVYSEYLYDCLASHSSNILIDKACRLTELKQDLMLIAPSFNDFAKPKLDLIHDEATALGVLYVLLGSTLGGRQIGKQLIQNHDPKIKLAVHYFVGDVSDRRVIWKKFIQLLDDYPHDELMRGTLVLGAKNTFNAIQIHMQN
jgi:heme oxygenase (biliverdin-IX-beta and delta-forming)